jgi:hypothetical protein
VVTEADSDRLGLYSMEELAAIDAANAFETPSRDAVETIYARAVDALQSSKSEPCAVCELTFPQSEISHIVMDAEAIAV